MRALEPRALGLLGLVLVAGSLSLPAEAAPTWLAPATPLSALSGLSYEPVVVVDAAGGATAAWSTYVSTPSFHRIVQAAYRPAGGAWGQPVQISDPTDLDNSETPDLGVAADGTVTAVWSVGTYPDGPWRVKAASRAPGGTWSAPDTLVSDGDFFPLPSIAVTPAGEATVVYRYFPPASVLVLQARTRPPGGSWGPVAPLEANPGVLHDVAAGPDGTTVAVWPTSIGGSEAIRASVHAPGGTWTPPVTISGGAPGDANHPDIEASANGTFTVAWERKSGSSYYVQAATRAAGGAWLPADDVSTPALNESIPVVAVNAAGDAAVAWPRFDGVSYTLRASRRAAGGLWEPALDVSPASEALGNKALLVDPDGTARAVWETGKGGNYSLSTSSRAPGSTWTAASPLTSAIPAGHPVSLAGDPAGNAVLVWAEGANPTVIEALTLDGAAPTISGFSAPATGTAGKPVSYAAAASDLWSAVASYQWSFGDGTTATGPILTHTFAAAGSYQVSLVVTDAVGNATTRTATTTVAVPAPVLSVFKLTDPKIALDEKTKVKLRLNAAATVKLVLKSKHQHLVKGKRKRIRVVIKKTVPAGVSKITVRGRKLVPDSWVVKGTATNASGTSSPRTVTLKVVR